jgi:HupE/UreJ protein
MRSPVGNPRSEPCQGKACRARALPRSPSPASGLAIGLAIALAATPAAAHQSSVSYSQVQVGDDGRIDYTLRLSSRDLYEALGLDRDRDASDDEILRGAERLVAYVSPRLAVGGDGRPCPSDDTAGRPAVTILHQTDRFAELRFAFRCGLPLHTLALDYQLFFELDPRHVGMLQVSHRERTLNQEFSVGVRRFEWNLDLAGPSLGIAAYVKKGMEHIYGGADHIAFLIGLLLMAAITRPRVGDGPNGASGEGAWRARELRAGIPHVLKIVTAFTVAHSLTLILAALDVIALPRQFVESAIAASIVYVAVENVWPRRGQGQGHRTTGGEPRHRWALAFAFGLVHGLGFAAMLRPILPRTGVVGPLLAFNVGVELGQITIVAVLLPVLALAAQRDARRYHRLVVVGGSALIGVAGTLWLAERILDVKILGWLVG